MADYSTWPEKNVAVTSLQLDAQNPRIPPVPQPLEQPDLISEMVAHEDVLDLATNIAQNGYFTVESLIGVIEKEKTIVIEGNRRLAALKLLINPDLAPERTRRKLQDLSKKVDLDTIARVRVLIAPSREAAAPLIIQKHTRTVVERWSPLMQARYYQSLLDTGLSIASLAAQYGGTPSDVTDFLKILAAYQFACTIDLPAHVRDVVHDPRRFDVSPMRRLMEMPVARSALGIDFDKKGHIQNKASAKRVERAFKRILTDIVEERLTTRRVNTVDDARDYLNEMGQDRAADIPAVKRASDGDADPNSEPEGDDNKKRGKRRQRQSTSLVPLHVKCTLPRGRVFDVFDELKRLKPLDKFHNSVAIVLRILLELAVHDFLVKKGKLHQIVEAQRLKEPNLKSDWSPTLKQMLVHMAKDPSKDVPPLAKRELNKLSQRESPISIETLDGFVHSQYSAPTTKELRAIWTSLEPVLELVLTGPLATLGEAN